MRIGVYVDVAKDDHPTGIGKHVRALLEGLSRVDGDNQYLLYYECGLFNKKTALNQFSLGSNFQLRPVRFPHGWVGEHPTAWWKWWLPRVVLHDKLQVFHGPNHFLPMLSATRSVVTIHDLAYCRMETLYSDRMNKAMKWWTTNAMKWADRVICISETTKRDVLELGVKSSKCRVIYNGGGTVVPESQIAYDRSGEVRRSLKLPGKYILYVGAIGPRKNLPFLLRAFAKLKAQGSLKHGLVLAGPRDSASDEIQRVISDLRLSAQVVITDYVEEGQLPLLYKMADCFVLPSRYEGFGMTTVEAMAYGIPVVATDSSSIREVTGGAALLVPIDNDDSLASAIHAVLADARLRNRQIEKGYKRASFFTWERCARETLALYTEVSQGSGQLS